MRLLIAFLLGMAAMVAIQGHSEDSIVVSGLAVHLDGDKHCNSITEGLGWEHSQSENLRSQIGFYRNSNCRWSTYAAEAWTPLKLGPTHSGIIAGLVTGYRASITPVAGLVTTYDLGKFALNIVTIPPSGDSGKGVLWFQLSFPLRW